MTIAELQMSVCTECRRAFPFANCPKGCGTQMFILAQQERIKELESVAAYWSHAINTGMIRDGEDGVALIKSEVDQMAYATKLIRTKGLSDA